MPKWLQAVIAVILLVGLACLIVYCVAVAKDMSFVDYIKSWFETASNVEEPVEDIADSVANFIGR